MDHHEKLVREISNFWHYFGHWATGTVWICSLCCVRFGGYFRVLNRLNATKSISVTRDKQRNIFCSTTIIPIDPLFHSSYAFT